MMKIRVGDLELEYRTPLPHFRPDFLIVLPSSVDIFRGKEEWRDYFEVLESEMRKCVRLLSPDVVSSDVEGLLDKKGKDVFLILLNSFVSSVTVSRSREEGTAHINLEFPNYAEPLFDSMRRILDQPLSSMVPLRIYMRGRFVNRMYPVFTGYITHTSYFNKGGYWGITVDCTDTLKLLSINPINVNPGIVERRLFGRVFEIEEERKEVGFRFSAWAFPFTNLTLEETIKYLIEGTAKKEIEKETGRISIDGIGTLEMWWNPILETDEEKSSKKVPRPLRYEISPYSFFNPKVKICTQYQITPYKYMDLANRQMFFSEMVSRLDVIREITERTFHEFFADEVGDFVLIPMRLNYWFLKFDFVGKGKGKGIVLERFPARADVDDGTYILMDDELLNLNVSFSDKEVYTAVDIYGEYPFATGSNEYVEWAMRGFAQNPVLLSRLGLRWLRQKIPLINNLDLLLQNDKKMMEELQKQRDALTEMLQKEGDPKRREEIENKLRLIEELAKKSLDVRKKSKNDVQASLNTFADAWMMFINSKAYSGSATLILRPEMVPAKPVYIPDREEIFYIDSVTHTISVGGNATTELSLIVGRKVYEAADFMDDLMKLHSPEKIPASIWENMANVAKDYEKKKEEEAKKRVR
jgi:hypothetical protein